MLTRFHCRRKSKAEKESMTMKPKWRRVDRFTSMVDDIFHSDGEDFLFHVESIPILLQSFIFRRRNAHYRDSDWRLHWFDGLRLAEDSLVCLARELFLSCIDSVGVPCSFLCGPSGCGKTLLIQTLSNDDRVNFIQVKVERSRWGGSVLKDESVFRAQNCRTNMLDPVNKMSTISSLAHGLSLHASFCSMNLKLWFRGNRCHHLILSIHRSAALVSPRRDFAGVTNQAVSELLTELDGVEAWASMWSLRVLHRR